MNMEEENKNTSQTSWCEEILENTEKLIADFGEKEINQNNVDYLYKLIDIHKDLKNEEYWKEKIDIMRYRNYNGYGNYGNYGNDNYGNYGRENYGRGNYNARGYDTRYRGGDMMDNMYRGFEEYSANRDNYGADEATLRSLDKMLNSAKDFMKMLKNEAKSQEEVEMIKEAAREISEM